MMICDAQVHTGGEHGGTAVAGRAEPHRPPLGKEDPLTEMGKPASGSLETLSPPGA
jgi:hypothetical protein